MNKSDFPIFITYPELVYLDSAATSQKPRQVIDALSNFYETSNANVHRGIYALSEKATAGYEQARETVAKFIGAESREIVFTSGTTESLNMLAYSLPVDSGTILVGEMEHHSNILPWQQLALRKGLQLKYVGMGQDFRLDLQQLRQLLQENEVKILALTHMSNTMGTINPLEQIVPMVREIRPECMIVVDAAQSVPHFPVDVKKLDVDFLVFSGHKMLGPTGIGVLYGKAKHLEGMEPFMTGGGMISKVEREHSLWAEIPHKFEAGTPPIAEAFGLKAAIDYLNMVGQQALQEHETELTAYFLDAIKSASNLTFYGPDTAAERGAVFSFNINNIHPHDLAQVLDEETIAVRAGHHCNQILMREVLEIPATVRASLYLYNEKSDIDKLIMGLEKAKNKFGVK